VREIKPLVLAHLCFNSYAPELVPIFYSAIKPGYRCFIFLLFYVRTNTSLIDSKPNIDDWYLWLSDFMIHLFITGICKTLFLEVIAKVSQLLPWSDCKPEHCDHG